MKSKNIKITNFALKTLEAYVIDLEFKGEMNSIKIHNLAQLSQDLKDEKFYDVEPELRLLPKPGELFKLGLGPLTFSDSNTKNQLQLGSNFLKIIIKEYDNWGEEYNKIKGIFELLKPFIGDVIVRHLQITCINNFDKIKREDDFKLSNFFTHNLNSELDIEYEDFHLGFVPHLEKREDEIEKVVLKLRGIPPKDPNLFLFKLESHFINRNIEVNFSSPRLLTIINYSHNFLNSLFIHSLSDSYRGKLGLTFEESKED